MSTDTIPAPSAATIRREIDNDAGGMCRVCEAPPDCKCDEVAHRLARGGDPVTRPAHYTRGTIEVRDFVADQQLNFNRGSAVKYVCRAGHKDPSREVEDLAKAVSCLQHEIARLKHQPTASRSHPQATAAEANPAGGKTGPRIPTLADSYGSAVDYGVCLLCGRHTGRIDTPAITRTPAVELGEEES